jgi:hypothetical protein
MSKTLISSLIALSFFAAGSAAEAATKKIKYDANELGFIAPAIGGDGFSVVQIDGVTSFLSVPVVLPADYKNNSQIKVKVNYSINQTGCNLLLSPFAVLRARSGLPPSGGLIGAPGIGLAVVGSTTVATPAITSQVFSQATLLNKDTVGAVTSQKAGDTITIYFARGGGAVADTCTNGLNATGATIIYQTN